MNIKQAEKKLVALLDRKPEIDQPGRLIPHLVNELGVTSDGNGRQRETIVTALERLAESGAIELEKVGKVYSRVRRVRHTSERYQERGAELRRQRNHATDATGAPLPSHLPDSMCSPVIVRFDQSIIKQKEEEVVIPPQRQPGEGQPKSEEPLAVESPDEDISSVYKTGDLFHETLTDCLQALRIMASPDGVSEDGVGVRQVLMAHGLTEHQASRVMEYLHGMSMYTSWMSGFQKSTYKVALEPEVITPEMVKQYRSQTSGSKAASKTDADATAVVSSDELNPVDKLAAIILRLEAEVADLTQKLDKANERLQDAARKRSSDRDKIAYRDAKLKKAETRIQELETDLSKVQSSPVLPSSSLAAEILDRYR